MTSPHVTRSVAIIGASDNPSRYAYMAMRMLEDYGHAVHLVSPRITAVEGRVVFPTVSALSTEGISVDTVTMYVGPTISNQLTPELLALKPQRVIFNPGAENRSLAQVLANDGIEVLEACTLVLLKTHGF